MLPMPTARRQFFYTLFHVKPSGCTRHFCYLLHVRCSVYYKKSVINRDKITLSRSNLW